MSKKIKIICDDIEYNLETVDDKTILDIALDNDIDAPYSCQGGISVSYTHLTLPTIYSV